MEKLLEAGALAAHIEELKKSKKKIIFTNGCFDILHAGHVRYLQASRALGDVLIVGLNSDVSVQGLKGPTRPINNEGDRAEVLAGLSAVDGIIIFSEQTAERLIELVKPDIYVKGGDYVIEQIPEARIVEKAGGKVVLIPEVPGRSSTKIITRIKETCEK
jgi:D-glycero-beta-D-manno-heptose 1-phosphate adenylyltransferase